MINKKQNTAIASIIIITMIFQLSCKPVSPSDLSQESIIPRPVSITATGDYFTIKKETGIYIQGESQELNRIGQYLAGVFRPSTGYPLDVRSTGEAPGSGNILMTLSGAAESVGEEGYVLNITKKLVTLSAKTPAGLFHGIQTIRQLLPADIELNSKSEGPWKIATGTIVDNPVYSFRSTMIDVARHFFDVNEIKHIIDFLSYYKFNALHLHLTDDQGWRIEIKAWPNLTAFGGRYEVGGTPGGFYTQEQFSEIVKYADDHFITIVPEIEMPGHSNAALSSYAELNCNGKATKSYTGTEVGFSTFCAKKDITYKFVDDVVKELAAITTGEYLHIGGDESHSTKKGDYILFVNKVQDIVLSHGKKVIGWDEISNASLKPGATAQFWANAENATRAVEQGAKILFSPAAKAYVDMKYDSTTTLGLQWAGFIEVDVAYSWDPDTLVPGIGKDNIMGIEPCLWTETTTNMDEMEYMVFPRLPGYAEIGWSPSVSRNWDEYKGRLAKHGERLKAMGINFYKSWLVPFKE